MAAAAWQALHQVVHGGCSGIDLDAWVKQWMLTSPGRSEGKAAAGAAPPAHV